MWSRRTPSGTTTPRRVGVGSASRAPVLVPHRRRTSCAPGYTDSVINGRRSGSTTRQSSTATDVCDRARRKPARPLVTAARTVVRYDHAGNSTVGFAGTSARPPMRLSASSTMSCFSDRCAPTSTCCHWHAPHPLASSGHGGAIRSGDGSSTSSSRALKYPRCSDSTATRTRSPGNAPSTNTTRPSGSRASALPPATMAVGTSSNTAPESGRVTEGSFIRRHRLTPRAHASISAPSNRVPASPNGRRHRRRLGSGPPFLAPQGATTW